MTAGPDSITVCVGAPAPLEGPVDVPQPYWGVGGWVLCRRKRGRGREGTGWVSVRKPVLHNSRKSEGKVRTEGTTQRGGGIV